MNLKEGKYLGFTKFQISIRFLAITKKMLFNTFPGLQFNAENCRIMIFVK